MKPNRRMMVNAPGKPPVTQRRKPLVPHPDCVPCNEKKVKTLQP